jgi:hypothetical protein
MGMVVAALASFGVAAACGGDSTQVGTDGGNDATVTDAGLDATDAGDGGQDAAADAPADAGPGGQFDWALAEPGADLFGLAADAQGDVYVLESFEGTITLGGNTYVSAGGRDALAFELDPTGTTVLWATAFGGDGDEEPSSISVDSSGNVYVAGWFYGTSLIFGTAATIPNTSTAQIPTEGFVAKLDSTGAPVWAYAVAPNDGDAGTGSSSYCRSVSAASTSGEIVAGCTFVGGVVVAMGTTATPTYVASTSGTNGATEDGLVVAMDDTAHGAWWRRLGGDGFDEVDTVTRGANDDVFVSGLFHSATLVDDTGNFTLGYTGGGVTPDPFYARIDATAHTVSQGIARDVQVEDFGVHGVALANGNAAMAGDFWEYGNFGKGQVSAKGTVDSFVFGFTPSTGATSWVQTLGVNSVYETVALFDLAAAPTNDVVAVGGYTQRGFTFGTVVLPDPPGAPDAGVAPGEAGYVLKISSIGAPLWAHGVTTAAAGGSVYTDVVTVVPGAGRVVYGGTFDAPADFGSGTPTSLPDANGSVYIVEREP